MPPPEQQRVESELMKHNKYEAVAKEFHYLGKKIRSGIELDHGLPDQWKPSDIFR